MKEYKIKSYAKLNLYLDVLGKMTNGYHEVEMIMQSIDLFDTVTLSWEEGAGYFCKCDHADVPTDESNIAVKAWLRMKKKYNITGRLGIDIQKRIPLGAGLAGGSANAAAVIFGVNKCCGLGLSMQEMMEVGSKIGADVPFCLLGGTAIAEGFGEKITPLPAKLPTLWFVLINPGIQVSTKKVYDLYLPSLKEKKDFSEIVKAVGYGQMDILKKNMYNILEKITFSLYPETKAIKQELTDLGLPALMSGSGSTVFGMTEDKEKAYAIHRLLVSQKKWPHVYMTSSLRKE